MVDMRGELEDGEVREGRVSLILMKKKRERRKSESVSKSAIGSFWIYS